jgi:hypothetical protein
MRGLNMPITTHQHGGGGTLSYVMVKHTVADYARWKLVFDADGANRQASGSKGDKSSVAPMTPMKWSCFSNGIWKRPAYIAKVKR